MKKRIKTLKPVYEYRGITWTTDIELCHKLGRGKTYVTYRRNKMKQSYREIIDSVLDNNTPKKYFGKEFTVKEYRGITWCSNRDLSRKLQKPAYYVNYHKQSGKTYEEIIDQILDVKKEYRGIKWTSDNDLSKKLGKYRQYVCYHRSHNMSYKDIIDKALDVQREYRGITWRSNRELCKKLGYCSSYVLYHIRNGKTYEDIIDQVLDDKK